MRKVLVISLGSSFGGTEVYVRSLSVLLQSEIEFSALVSQQALAVVLKPYDVECTLVPAMKRAAKPLQLLRALLKMVGLIRRKKIDSIIVNGYTEILLIPFAKFCGARAFATRHLTFEIEVDHWWQDPGRFAARWVYRCMAQFADGIVAVSETVGAEMRLIVPVEKVHVISNWIPLVKEARSQQDRGTPVKLLFVGRLTRLKGLAVLLQALHLLHTAGETNWNLTIVGQGDYEAELKSITGALPVTFAGFHLNMLPFYSEADIFINPSQGPEGLPLVTLEAMAHALPTILSDLPVFLEISRNGVDAMLFRKDDPQALATRLREMIASPELRATYSASAARAIAERYSPNHARNAYLHLLAS